MTSSRPQGVPRPLGRVAALIVTAALPACTVSKGSGDERVPDEPSVAAGAASPIGSGETVAAIDRHIWAVFQSRDGAYWFGSNGSGVYRCDGRTIVRFTTAHGLGGDHVRAIQGDRAGNVYVASDPGGVSRFDGRAFGRLRALEAPESAWKLQPDDLWFPGGTDSGVVYRYDGASLHRLAFPETEAGKAHHARYPRALFPAMKYSPYDVYTIFKDSRGHLWFGTCTLGACRYDGTSFAWVDTVGLGLGANDSFGVRSIIEDRDGRFWFTHTLSRFDVQLPATGERGPVALAYRKEPSLGDMADKVPFFVSAVQDGNGDLLLATLGDGVWRCDGTRTAHLPVKHGNSPVSVICIHRDRQGVLWLGTHENGVYRFNGKTFEQSGF